MPRDSYDRIVIAVRAEHETKYQATALLHRVFGPDADVLVLPRDTRGPADTVAEMIRRASVTGAFVVKDADSFFDPCAIAIRQLRCAERRADCAAHDQCWRQELCHHQREQSHR